jgi:hypothetical protein
VLVTVVQSATGFAGEVSGRHEKQQTQRDREPDEPDQTGPSAGLRLAVGHPRDITWISAAAC